jgi:hypothetical protein
MKTLTGLFAAVVALALAGRASANVIVSYGFDETNSTFSITSPVQLTIPPGTIDGVVKVAYSSDSQGNIENGPATLEVLDLDANMISTPGTVGGIPFTLTGPVSAHLVSAVEGELTGDQLDFGSALGTFDASGNLVCAGTPCIAVHFPSGQPFSGSGTVPLPVLTVASIHGIVSGLSFNIGTLPVVVAFNINGTETGRQLPEPAVAALLAGAAAALVARARRRAS